MIQVKCAESCISGLVRYFLGMAGHPHRSLRYRHPCAGSGLSLLPRELDHKDRAMGPRLRRGDERALQRRTPNRLSAKNTVAP